jgi:hypothetical protein
MPTNKTNNKSTRLIIDTIKNPTNILLGILISMVIASYQAQRTDIRDLRADSKENAKECMSEINKVRKESTENYNTVQKDLSERYDKLKDQLLAMLNKINK